MEHSIEFYPKSSTGNKSEYYIEFSRWGADPELWTLFKRQYYPKHLWCDHPFMSNEIHPWNLGEGVVDKSPIISMNRKGFLMRIVDSLNSGMCIAGADYEL